jgi:hypothetical protein
MAARFEFDEFGMARLTPDTAGMHYPVACGICGHVHDSGKVEVVARYADCDMWRCPSCHGLQDNRWGLNSPGTARKLY